MKTIVTIMCRNDELSLRMSWVGCLLKDSELFILFAENSQILLKTSGGPTFLTFIYLVALNSDWTNSTHPQTQLIIAPDNWLNWLVWKFVIQNFCQWSELNMTKSAKNTRFCQKWQKILVFDIDLNSQTYNFAGMLHLTSQSGNLLQKLPKNSQKMPKIQDFVKNCQNIAKIAKNSHLWLDLKHSQTCNFANRLQLTSHL